MLIVIAIQDIWKRFGEDSQALQNIGLRVEDVVKLAYGYACLTNRPYAHEAMIPVSANIFTTVRDLLVDRLPFDDRLPFTRQSGYGVNDQIVHRVVDIVGEISQMLSDAVIRQVGHFPAGLILQRLMGPDLVLYYNSEDSRVPHPFAESRTS